MALRAIRDFSSNEVVPFFRRSAAQIPEPLEPTAGAVGCIFSPLRG